MKLYIKQRFFTLTDKFDIYDEFGNSKYFVNTEYLTFGHQMHVYDANNQEIGGIFERVLTLLPKFDIEVLGNYCGMIKKEFSFLYPIYHIDFNNWHVEGDFMGWDYDVFDQNNQIVAHISKDIFHLTDQYVIDIYNPDDEMYALMLVLAIDAANCTNG